MAAFVLAVSEQSNFETTIKMVTEVLHGRICACCERAK